MLIGISLFVMLVLMVFSIILGSVVPGTIISSTTDVYLVVNGTRHYLETQTEDAVFYLDPVFGAIGIFIVIIVIVGFIGLQIFGSGLSELSVKVISGVIIYGGLWAIVSVLSMPLILSIEVFGSLIYLGLTIIYVVGVVNKLYGGGPE
ncbi:hypothetical protein ES702_05540 [subsurface metagenome]